jgi:hypothetical protein
MFPQTFHQQIFLGQKSKKEAYFMGNLMDLNEKYPYV